jgi:glycosyltransferase involved in cell wall biosynthesis
MKTTKTFWIINQDATTPEVGYAGRSYYLANELGKLGHTVYLIAGSFSHLHFSPTGVKNSFEIRDEQNFKMVWVKLPSYTQSHSKKRILNWFLLGYKITVLNSKIGELPDYIYYSSPSLIPYLGALRLKEKLKAKLIFEFRDIWPKTLQEIGGYGDKNPLIVFMKWVEKLAYQRSDIIFSNLSNAYEYLKGFGVQEEKFLWVPNGFSSEEKQNKAPLNAEVNAQIPHNKFIVGYSGTLGVSNALEYFLEASIKLQAKSEILFVVVGTGQEKEKLKKMVHGNQNVLFFNSVSKPEVFELLERFDVCYLGWKKHEIYNYGIGSNKMPEYLMSGKPILHSYSGVNDPIIDSGAGFSFEAENVDLIVQNILKIYEMDVNQRDLMGIKGKLYAEKKFGYENLAEKINLFLSLK